MTKDEYCINVCKGKCCYRDGLRCAYLKDGACKIYKQRFREGACDFVLVDIVQINQRGETKKVPFFCFNIQTLINEDKLSEDIKAQCVYAHPELLEKYKNGSKACSSKLA